MPSGPLAFARFAAGSDFPSLSPETHIYSENHFEALNLPQFRLFSPQFYESLLAILTQQG